MNKKIAIAALLVLSPVGMAMAAQNNVGCGVGSIIFDGQGGVAPQVLAVTTNGTFGNQTFGISSGTLGCSQDGVVTSTQKLSMFLDTNLDKVAYEMSVGAGETLESLASLMGVQEADKAAFFAALRDNFAEIVPSSQASTQDVVAGLNRVLSQDAALAQYATLS
ncbi:MAG: DUF3015 domain-containing protein [Chromatiales bacterium]|jgi:hypothetical protein|nr:DUF3015 domain-containing protein [Chromatiales bacterium]